MSSSDNSKVEFFVSDRAEAEPTERIEVRLAQTGPDRFTVYLADEDGMIQRGKVVNLIVRNGRLAIERCLNPNRRYVQRDYANRRTKVLI